jgi:4-hydroxy-4-methyl-2-oxoglutarate aldolase
VTMDLATAVAELRRVGYSAVVSDCCDHIGLRGQTLAPGILPLDVADGVLVGLARPTRSVAVDSLPEQPYETEIAFIDSLRPDDVVVASVPAPVAFWGELFSTAARARGAVGVVVDGLVRDQGRIKAMGFPMFARGGRPTDSLGRIRMAEHDVPVVVGGVQVSRWDLVGADVDDVVVVPQEAAVEVARRAVAKATTENHARALIEGGALLRDAWLTYKVL